LIATSVSAPLVMSIDVYWNIFGFYLHWNNILIKMLKYDF
jgi:hypothetical protein